MIEIHSIGGYIHRTVSNMSPTFYKHFNLQTSCKGADGWQYIWIDPYSYFICNRLRALV